MAGLTELDELQQIRNAEAGTTGSDAHEGLRGRQAGPGERPRPDVRVILVGKKADAPVAPVRADTQDFEALSAQGMKGMRYFEEVWSIRLTWCC